MQLRSRVGRYLPDLVYGANDGIVTTFAIVSGVIGAGLSDRVILALGFASLLADGFSMGTSKYLSERSSREGGDDRSDPATAARRGSATFFAFVGAGAVALVAYVLPVDDLDDAKSCFRRDLHCGARVFPLLGARVGCRRGTGLM